MKKERTAIIIKPDAYERGLVDTFLQIIRCYGDILIFKHHKMTTEEAKSFYSVHKSKFFYDRLCEYMTSGMSAFIVLEGDKVVSRIRTLMENYIRPRFGLTITKNSMHGSDSAKSAKKEIRLITRLK